VVDDRRKQLFAGRNGGKAAVVRKGKINSRWWRRPEDVRARTRGERVAGVELFGQS
jgi:hypothetical protein